MVFDINKRLQYYNFCCLITVAACGGSSTLTNNFYGQVRNFIFVMVAIAAYQAATSIHWPTAQPTSIQSVAFKVNDAPSSLHRVIFVERAVGRLHDLAEFLGVGSALILEISRLPCRPSISTTHRLPLSRCSGVADGRTTASIFATAVLASTCLPLSLASGSRLHRYLLLAIWRHRNA